MREAFTNNHNNNLQQLFQSQQILQSSSITKQKQKSQGANKQSTNQPTQISQASSQQQTQLSQRSGIISQSAAGGSNYVGTTGPIYMPLQDQALNQIQSNQSGQNKINVQQSTINSSANHHKTNSMRMPSGAHQQLNLLSFDEQQQMIEEMSKPQSQIQQQISNQSQQQPPFNQFNNPQTNIKTQNQNTIFSINGKMDQFQQQMNQNSQQQQFTNSAINNFSSNGKQAIQQTSSTGSGSSHKKSNSMMNSKMASILLKNAQNPLSSVVHQNQPNQLSLFQVDESIMSRVANPLQQLSQKSNQISGYDQASLYQLQQHSLSQNQNPLSQIASHQTSFSNYSNFQNNNNNLSYYLYLI